MMDFDYGNFGDLGLVEYYIANLPFYNGNTTEDDLKNRYIPSTLIMVYYFNDAMIKLGWESPFRHML